MNFEVKLRCPQCCGFALFRVAEKEWRGTTHLVSTHCTVCGFHELKVICECTFSHWYMVREGAVPWV